MTARIIIRRLSGPKNGRLEEFPIESFPELTIGRDPSATILFDAREEQTVSPRHALIKVNPGDPSGFMLADLGSSTGTFLNGERVAGETELLPGDIVELGGGGPKFAFEVGTVGATKPGEIDRNSIAVQPSDTELQTLVEQTLQRELGPGLANIAASVKDAVVTLTGLVGSDDHKSRVEALARQVSGVANVANSIAVRPSDAELQTQVEQALQRELGPGLANIAASVKDEVVTLTGLVGSADHKSRVEALARQVSGVANVANSIAVRPSDAELQTQVEQALQRELGPGLANIAASVKDAVVTLTGLVGSDDHKSRVEALARQVSGVANVANSIAVRPSDAELQTQVEQALQRELGPGLANIAASVKDAVVTLTGLVGSADHKSRVEALARQVSGVANVANSIAVRPSDAELQTQVEQALQRELGPGLANIAASVKDAVVTLTGLVGSADYKSRAEALVQHVSGIVGVDNRVALPPPALAEKKRWLLPVAAIFGLFVCLVLGIVWIMAKNSGPTQDSDAAQRQIHGLQSTLEKAQTQIHEREAKLAAATADLGAAQKRNQELQAKLNAKSADLEAALARVKNLEDQLKKIVPPQNTHFLLSRRLFDPRTDDNSVLITPSGKFWWEDDLCAKYLKYTPDYWDKNYKKSADIGTSHVYVASLDAAATEEDAAKYANRFRASFPTINFYEWRFKGSNPRWTVLLAQGLSDMDTVQSIVQFAKQCIVGDAFRRAVSSEGG